MTDGTGHSTYGYGADGQLTSTTDGGGHVIGYHYNADGNPDKITYPNGHNITMAYNNGQQMTGITDWNSHAFGFGYGPDGNLTTQTDPNGDTATTTYNADGQITGITDKNAGGTTLAGFAYTRGSDGEPATATTTGTAITAAADTYTYNPLGQLTGDNSTSYGYDHGDDPWILSSHIGQGFTSANEIVNHVIDGTTNTGYAFNPRGDRTTATTSSVTTSYGYDQANHLTTYTPPTGPATTYAYNGQGLRTAKTTSGTTTSYTWDTAGSLPLMLTAGTTSYIYGPDGLPIETIDSSRHPHLPLPRPARLHPPAHQPGRHRHRHLHLRPLGQHHQPHRHRHHTPAIHRPVPRRRNRVLLPPAPLLRPRHRPVPHHRPPRQPNPSHLHLRRQQPHQRHRPHRPRQPTRRPQLQPRRPVLRPGRPLPLPARRDRLPPCRTGVADRRSHR